MENFMAGEIQAAFNTVYADGPSTEPDEPSKPRIRTELAPVIQKSFDDAVSLAGVGIKWKNPVRAASASNVALSSIVNGASFGGVTVVTGDPVGVVGQSGAAENGAYVVQASGPPVRRVDLDTGDEFPGAAFMINEGTLAGQAYACVTTGAITVGTTPLTFRKVIDISSQNTALNSLTVRVEDLEEQKTTMRRFVEILLDGWVSVEICLIGDSITWMLAATGSSSENPRTGELTDPRNNLTAPGWANLFRDYLIANFCALAGGEVLQNPSPGVGYARRWVEGDPTTEARFRYISRSTGLDLTKPVMSGGSFDNATFRRTLDIPANNSNRALEFSFTGTRSNSILRVSRPTLGLHSQSRSMVSSSAHIRTTRALLRGAKCRRSTPLSASTQSGYGTTRTRKYCVAKCCAITAVCRSGTRASSASSLRGGCQPERSGLGSRQRTISFFANLARTIGSEPPGSACGHRNLGTTSTRSDRN